MQIDSFCLNIFTSQYEMNCERCFSCCRIPISISKKKHQNKPKKQSLRFDMDVMQNVNVMPGARSHKKNDNRIHTLNENRCIMCFCFNNNSCFGIFSSYIVSCLLCTVGCHSLLIYNVFARLKVQNGRKKNYKFPDHYEKLVRT